VAQELAGLQAVYFQAWNYIEQLDDTGDALYASYGDLSQDYPGRASGSRSSVDFDQAGSTAFVFSCSGFDARSYGQLAPQRPFLQPNAVLLAAHGLGIEAFGIPQRNANSHGKSFECLRGCLVREPLPWAIFAAIGFGCAGRCEVRSMERVLRECLGSPRAGSSALQRHSSRCLPRYSTVRVGEVEERRAADFDTRPRWFFEVPVSEGRGVKGTDKGSGRFGSLSCGTLVNLR